MKKIKVLELFGGIGACTKALTRLKISFDVVDYVEIDKFAVNSYNAIYGTNFESQDITTWNKDLGVDLIMHGSPCQDFSLAGKQAGGDKDSGTRSSLMWHTVRIVEKLKPKYVIWENVKNVLSKKHRHNFDEYLNKMEQLGYTNYYQVLNAKDYGIPQNRERVFTVSILGSSEYDFPKGKCCNNEVINPLKGKTKYSWQFEQNVYDSNGIIRALKAGGGSGNIPKVIERFQFPPKQKLKLRLKDILEKEVDEKYYLNNEKAKKLLYKLEETNQIKKETQFCCDATINEPKVRRIANCITARYDAGIHNQKQVGLSVVEQPCIEIKNATKKGYLKGYEGDGVDLSYPKSQTRRGRVGKQISQTLQCNDSIGVIVKKYEEEEKQNTSRNLRIRKLTPKECWRLMGFDDEDFKKAEKVNSNTQLYKQAGNSIVVNVLVVILKNLLLKKTNKHTYCGQMTIFDYEEIL